MRDGVAKATLFCLMETDHYLIMEITMSGMQLKTRQRWLAVTVELLSSMRFAISLLTIIAVASVIGTVLQQNEPMANYVNQFGPFWFEVFNKFSLYGVYSAWWFLLIMAFLVVSTSLCIVRNAPLMLRDMRSWRENVREQSLRNFRHNSEWQVAGSSARLTTDLAARIHASGYKTKVVTRGAATLIAAKKGAGNRWGYIFAHSAIVVIGIGGMLDSNLTISAQKWLFDKAPFTGNGVIAEIPAKYRLGIGNPTFRGNMLIPEGASSDTVIIPQQDGVMIQDLPFTIKLKRFVIDYYRTGQPKLFASDVVLTDHQTGKTLAATIKVNEPLIYHGVAIYQSSFEDGGSKLKLTGYSMHGSRNNSFELAGAVSGSTPLTVADGRTYTVEWSGFRPFNVENMARPGQDLRAVNAGKGFGRGVADRIEMHMGSAADSAHPKELKNVGPSVQYKLRDKNGQAREYLNYMQPVNMDGNSVFLAGMRDTPSDEFRYLRMPADDEGSLQEWMRLRSALADPALRAEAARRYALRALPSQANRDSNMQQQLAQSAEKSLSIFAGAETAAGFIANKDGNQDAGYLAVSRFLEAIPVAEQEKAVDIFMKILNGSMWDLWQAARAKDGLPAVSADEKHAHFLQLATNALSDSFFYSAPVYLHLTGYDQVQASVLQLTRSPGKIVVYFGCLLLVLGVFSMFYIRERRLWVWIKPTNTDAARDGASAADGDEQMQALMAMSTQRETFDFEREFETMKARLQQSA